MRILFYHFSNKNKDLSFDVNALPSDDSHEILSYFLCKIKKKKKKKKKIKMSSTAAVISTLRVKNSHAI